MAILSVDEFYQGREFVNAQPDRLLARRVFVVICSSAHDERTLIETAPGVPRRYEPYQTDTAFDPRLVVRSVNGRQRDNNTKVWDVLVEYDSEYEVRDDPFSEPPDIRFESEQYEEPLPGKPVITYDPNSNSPEDDSATTDGAFAYRNENGVFGYGVVTSAGEPYDPPITITKSRPIVRFIRNEPTTSIAFKVLFENTVNKTAWSGLQPRQAMLKAITATSHVQKSSTVGQPDIYYARVEYVFALKAETWDLQLLDIGSYYLKYDGATATAHAFRTATGEPRLGLLDNSDADQPGKKLASGQPAQFRRWRAYREQDYTNLGINLNLALEFRRARKRAG